LDEPAGVGRDPSSAAIVGALVRCSNTLINVYARRPGRPSIARDTAKAWRALD